MASTREKHDRKIRTPDLLTQEDFDRDENPENEFSDSEENERARSLSSSAVSEMLRDEHRVLRELRKKRKLSTP